MNENNEEKRIKFDEIKDQIDVSKLDLSEENMKRTIDYSKENVMLKDFKPVYDDLEIIIMGNKGPFDMSFAVANINNLPEDLKEMIVVSVHVYHDTATTSVIIKPKES